MLPSPDRFGLFPSARILPLLTAGWCILAAPATPVRAEPPADLTEKPDVEITRIDPLSPDEALESFEVADGYRIELVAAEPLVADPIAFSFDDQGRLIVVEMRGYSERPDALTGRVRRLSDTDGDGRMDEAETLVDGLSWPTAVECWPGGVVVGAAPEIFFVPEPTDSGEAKPQTWFRGFRRSNVQGLLNSFRWGPDLRLHGATSSSGGEITGEAIDEPIRLGRRDFAISLLDRDFQAVPGGAQHGLSFDRWGDKFVCSNSDHLQQVLMAADRPERATRYANVPPLRRSIAADGPQADVYRSSPVEPWRIIRTHLRVTGQVGGPVEGGGRAAGYFTGATGVHIYAGDQWSGVTEGPTALICDVGSNLIHRKRLDRDGLWRIGRRIDSETEFIRSSDIWFRPVQLGSGPDGAVYVADMYREVIEHPKSLPPEIKSQVDLNRGNDRGRIWRIVAEDQPLRRTTESLGEMATADLVDVLNHPNTWHRRTAGRLLVARQDRAALEPLRHLAAEAQQPETRLEALAVLANFDGGLQSATIQAAFQAPHPRVRQRAIQLAADNPKKLGPLTANRWQALAEDPSLFVRFQLAHDAAALIPQPADRAEALARIANRDLENEYIRWAAEGSLGNAAMEFLNRLDARLGDRGHSVPMMWLESVACQALHSGGESTAGQLVASFRDGSDLSDRLLRAVADQMRGVSPRGTAQPLAEWISETLAPQLTDRLSSGDLAPERAADRLKLVGWASPEQALELLQQLLSPNHPPAVQQVALRTLVGNRKAAIDQVLAVLPEQTPTVQATAMEVLASQRQGLRAVAEAVAEGELATSTLSEELKQQLRQFPDEAVRESLAGLLEPPPQKVSPEVLASYQQGLQQPGEASRGEEVFQRVCAVCHQPEDENLLVGPELRSIVEKSPDQILLSILEPNREVDPKYRRVLIETVDGRLFAGVLASETADSLQLVDSQGRPQQVAREDIANLRTTDESVMPEDLAKEITVDQMRDLIAYLRTQQPESSQP